MIRRTEREGRTQVLVRARAVLKMDKSFVHRIGRSARDDELVKAFIAQATARAGIRNPRPCRPATMVTVETFRAQLAELTARIATHQGGKPLDAATDAWLNREFGPASATYAALKRSCEAGVAAGWLCNREGGGIRYGRIFKPAPELNGFSVDVVDMRDLKGPHHVHPNGEIDLILPLEGDATFDGRPAGWCVYAPGTAHHPTVAAGRALILYLLPDGKIDFTGK